LEAASSASRQVLAGDNSATSQEALLNVFVDGHALDVIGIMNCTPKLWIWVRSDAVSPDTPASPTKEARAYTLKWILQKVLHMSANTNSPASKSPRKGKTKAASSTPTTPQAAAATAAAEAAAKWKEFNAIIERIANVQGHLDQRDPSICHLLFNENNVSLATSSANMDMLLDNSCLGINVLTLIKAKSNSNSSNSSNSNSISSSSSSSSSSSNNNSSSGDVSVGAGLQIVVLLGEPSSTANTPTKLWGLEELTAISLGIGSLAGDDVGDTQDSGKAACLLQGAGLLAADLDPAGDGDGDGDGDRDGDGDGDRDRERAAIFTQSAHMLNVDVAAQKLAESLSLLNFSNNAISSEESLIV